MFYSTSGTRTHRGRGAQRDVSRPDATRRLHTRAPKACSNSLVVLGCPPLVRANPVYSIQFSRYKTSRKIDVSSGVFDQQAEVDEKKYNTNTCFTQFCSWLDAIQGAMEKLRRKGLEFYPILYFDHYGINRNARSKLRTTWI